MRLVRRLILDIIIITTIVSSVTFIYKNYREPLVEAMFGERLINVYINDVSLAVSIADDPGEREQGLSDTDSLPPTQGKLFIFDAEGDYGFWMKDMNYPIDILWIDNDFEVVHIEENVRPESYPATYRSPFPARFVIETNAFFVDVNKLQVGDRVFVPENAKPVDLRQTSNI